MIETVLSLNPLKIFQKSDQGLLRQALRQLPVIAMVTFAAGCQINRPVPVDYIGATSVNDRYDDSRTYNRPRPYSNPYPSTAYRAPEPQTQWAPINITPIDMDNNEPTQPLNAYEQNYSSFRPQPMRPVAATNDYGRSGVHIVQRGESLYGIARANGISVRELAAYNQLAPPYEIYPNQQLYLSSQGGSYSDYTGPAPTYNSTPSAYATPAPTTPLSPQPVAATSAIEWAWPTQGALIGEFVSGKTNGIEIAGQPGRIIRASADGTVLYSGNEVTGYGELVIIDHGQGFMSTYAHNRRLLVKQGDRVRKGDQIAEMGSSEADRTKLHFEIRKSEKPVDPLAYLPRQ